MTINPTRLFRTLKTLNTFIDRSLGFKPKGKFLSGFHYEKDILKASVANTYVETKVRIQNVPQNECMQRITVRYHTRKGKLIPEYVCQKQGIKNASKLR